MLGDIMCNQLMVSHLVATFSVGDHRDGHGRYAVRASGSKKQNEYVFSLCLTRQIIKTDRGRKHVHFVAWDYTQSIFQECRDYRRQKCREQVTDQELSANQNVNKHVIDPPTVWVLSRIISVVYVIWFELRFQSWALMTETVPFGSTVDSQKKIMIMLAPALSLACQSEYGVGHKHSHVVFGMSWRTFIEYQQWASSYHGYVHCFRRWTNNILQHWIEHS